MSEEPEPPGEPEPIDGSGDPVALLIKMAGPRSPVAEEVAARVRAWVHSRWRRVVMRHRLRSVASLIGAQLAAAAVLAILIKTGFWLWHGTPADGAPLGTVVRQEGHVSVSDGSSLAAGGALTKGSTLTTAADGRVALHLADGWSVRLDVGTTLRLSSPRTLDLQHGAVYIDTASMPSGGAGPATATRPRGTPSVGEAGRTGPMEVVTPLGVVRDVGTQFEVRVADDLLHVSVRRGMAVLARDGRDYAVPAGTRLRVDRSGVLGTADAGIRSADWDWVLSIAPPFDLEGRTLGNYLDWLSRETGWRVDYADPAIAARVATVILHGSTAGMRPDETPAAVLPTCGLGHRREGAVLIIEPADGRATSD